VEDSDGRVREGAIGAHMLGPGLDASVAAAVVGPGDECGSVAGGRGGRVDGGGQRSSGGWIQGDAARGVRTTEVAAGAALVRAICAAGAVEAAWFAQDARVVRRAWAGSAGGQPGARSALVVGSEGGSGVAGVRSARAVLAVWDAGAGRAADVVGAGEEGWGWLPKCRSHLWFRPRTDLSWPQLLQYFAPMLARVRWPLRSFSCTFERR
jgi:hypothetical protein